MQLRKVEEIEWKQGIGFEVKTSAGVANEYSQVHQKKKKMKTVDHIFNLYTQKKKRQSNLPLVCIFVLRLTISMLATMLSTVSIIRIQ